MNSSNVCYTNLQHSSNDNTIKVNSTSGVILESYQEIPKPPHITLDVWRSNAIAIRESQQDSNGSLLNICAGLCFFIIISIGAFVMLYFLINNKHSI